MASAEAEVKPDATIEEIRAAARRLAEALRKAGVSGPVTVTAEAGDVSFSYTADLDGTEEGLKRVVEAIVRAAIAALKATGGTKPVLLSAVLE
uniref:de novo designed protein AM2M n=1 Tax=synthetic construct TaxID=32630 RepID=UPI001E1E23F5|nr:Chain A, de novo designed protein AM2M [synthetic construct]7DKO_B Chain B, de novo designed protein AM2M [synthetic construct]7DKO_C Chain C, de novo designed protein AM2M [synthetic construct]